MQKKKILVVDYQLCLGGVGIAAVNLIENLKDEFDIELLLQRPGGVLTNRLPEGIKITYVDPKLTYYYIPFSEFRKAHPGFWNSVKRVVFGILNRLHLYNGIHKRKVLKCKQFLGDFDLIINNDMDALNGFCHDFTMLKANAKKKFLVLHGDFLKNKYNKKFFEKNYLKYDKIISVSESLNEQMKQVFPKFTEKFECLLNFQDTKTIISMADKEKITFDNKVINIVSASRLTEVKGYFRTLNVLSRFKNEGVNNFCWHILGDGEQREQIKNFIKENNLEKNVVLYGNKQNPYPYFKSADFVMLNSFHESYGLVLIESLIVKTPVFTTNTISAKELINDNYGWIVDNNDQGIYDGLKQVLTNPALLKEKKKNLKNYDYDNESIKNKLKELMK